MTNQTATNDNLQKELDTAIRIIRHAGQLIQPFYAQDTADEQFGLAWKGVNDPVTAADKAANAYIVSALSAAFPEDGILAEESVDSPVRLRKKRLWCIDPLDGTKEFIAHNGEFCVMIGLAIDGEARLGVLYQPVEERLYYGIVGGGAWKEEADGLHPLHVSEIDVASEMTAVFSRSHRAAMTAAIMEKFGVHKEIISGSVGLKVVLLSERRADLYVHPAPGTKEWDTCAPEAVLRAAGGMMTDMWGRPMRYNKADPYNYGGILASNGRLHRVLVSLAQEVLDGVGVSRDVGFHPPKRG